MKPFIRHSLPRNLTVLLLLIGLCGIWGGFISRVGAEPLPKQNPYEARNDRGIWDYNFTPAKSGLYWELFDTGRSEGKSGNKPETQKFRNPTWKKMDVHYDEVEALDVPYLLHPNDDKTLTVIRNSRDLITTIGRIPKGYYQVALRTEDPSMAVSYPYPKRPWKHKNKKGHYQWIVMKKQQKELGVFPITIRKPYVRQKNQRKSKRPFAVLEANQGAWMVSIYYRGTIYSAPAIEAYRPVIYPTTTGSRVEYTGLSASNVSSVEATSSETRDTVDAFDGQHQVE